MRRIFRVIYAHRSKLFASGGPSGALRGKAAGDAPRPRLVVWGPHTASRPWCAAHITRWSPNYAPAVCMHANGWSLANVELKKTSSLLFRQYGYALMVHDSVDEELLLTARPRSASLLQHSCKIFKQKLYCLRGYVCTRNLNRSFFGQISCVS